MLAFGPYQMCHLLMMGYLLPSQSTGALRMYRAKGDFVLEIEEKECAEIEEKEKKFNDNL